MSGSVVDLSSADLLAATRDLARRCSVIEADLLVHLAEVDERKLYLDLAHSSMFAFCVAELGFSEDAAYYRITVARAARQVPAVVEAIRSGKLHLGGARLLAPHLTVDNAGALLERAAGKSKREIEEQVAAIAPRPPVPTQIRRVAQQPAVQGAGALPHAESAALEGTPAEPVCAPAVAKPRSIVAPLSEDAFRVQFTAAAAFRSRLSEA